MKERLQINLSFKQSEKWLYNLLMKFSSPTAFIKDVLINYFKESDKNEKQ